MRAATAVLSCLLMSLGSGAAAQGPKLDLGGVFGSISPRGPGCGVGVAIPGAPALTAAYGQADLEHPEPLTPDTIFETGSLAKQFTAAAMMLLVQDGKLTLDDDIRRYLPQMPAYESPITIRNLLTHTSGLREQWSLLALTGNGPGLQVHSNPMILDLASRQKGLNFKPGAEFLYANTNYVLAATIVERVSGRSLQQFTDARLFQPLGMSHTRWREDFRTVVPGRATAYAPDGGGFIANMPITNVYGNGGLLTTLGDLLRWNAFLDKPSDLPGGLALVAALQTPGRLSNGAPLEYGLGLEVTLDHGRRLVSHSGSTGGYKTWLGRYPDEGVSIAVMCNNGGIDPVEMGERVAAEALRATGHSEAAVAAPEAIAAVQAPQGLVRNPATGGLMPRAQTDSAVLEAYAGTYYSAELDTRISVVRQGNGLVMRQPFAVEWALSPSFADGFTTSLRGTTTFVFERTAGGRVEGFGVWANGVRDLAFIKQ